ncbi:hypothetical protein KAFR_0C00930 [Kazachstania africana CBS 2517]|uniref:non-specific serine/threonine protein kinase n=1 Tax=Kazachstania africana (strain ATCC 22294 / BCRC 22015 / CBS 2517 / CECT 1963 / NBRC 1671 / NRRL Y-8276) TaxID=1071382 RepID=H2ART8_KAZAF|nr:hypothetical protein KAFR_0C00930 [Kazachstania africana CBS 2517]CCF57088.1 hypothetical protein KAFR_0C00930 [Kazachstania africana CBS 2517]
MVPFSKIQDQVNVTPAQQTNERSTNSVSYQLKQVIGKGSYGIVYKAINRRTEQVVAIKELYYNNDTELQDIMVEIDLLKNLDHVNIIKYHGFIQKLSNLYIILEFASHGSLKNLMMQRPEKHLNEKETRIYIKQTINGLVYLHEQGVIHRDIKAANLLLDASNTIKLADFGVSTSVANSAMTLAGSLNWMAPEIITNKGASTLSDIWSLGATIIELLTGNPPFHKLMDINIYYAIENDVFLPPENLSTNCQNILNLCFQKNMFKRPSAVSLLKHPWLKDITQSTQLPENLDFKSAKFLQFREDFEKDDLNWDDDFMDNQNLQNIKPSVESRSSSPVKDNLYLDTFNENDGTIHDGYHYLQKLKDREKLKSTILSIQTIFKDCKTDHILNALLPLLKCSPDHTDIVVSILSFDFEYNNAKLRNRLVECGGIPYIINNESIITTCFLKDRTFPYKILFQCGVMNNNNINKFKNNPQVYFRLLYKYLQATSLSFFYSWCESNLDCELIMEHIQNDKKVQAIILRLASVDYESHWLLNKLVPLLCQQKNQDSFYSSQVLYTILKSLAFMTQHSHCTIMHDNDGDMNDGNSLNSHSSSSSPTDRTILMTPSPLKLNSPIKSNFKNFGDSTRTSKIILKDDFENWLLGLLNHTTLFVNDNGDTSTTGSSTSSNSNVVNIKNNNNNNNIHVWKYFTKVCLNTIQINNKNRSFAKLLFQKPKFMSLINYILDQHELVPNKMATHLASVLQQLLNVLIEIVNLNTIHPDFVHLILRFLQFKDFISGGIEIVVKILSSSSTLSKENMNLITLKDLTDAFYKFEANNINFNSFLGKYTRLCSLQRKYSFLSGLSNEIIMHPGFSKDFKVFFKLYENSLLIQIEILKLLKGLFVTCDITDPVVEKNYKKLVKFLSANWDNKSNKETRQVGKDSVLIIQLCNDITNLYK